MINSTRDTLIDLGECAIRTYGFGGFSYADLARDAGIRKASIHHHFPAKADLGLAVLERYKERLAETFSRFQTVCDSAADELKSTVELYRAALGEGSTLCLCTALAGDGQRNSEAMQQALARTNTMVTARLAELLRRGATDKSLKPVSDPETTAVALLAQLQGSQLIARAAGSLELYDQASASILEELLA